MHAPRSVSPAGPNLRPQMPISVAVNTAKKEEVPILLSEHALA